MLHSRVHNLNGDSTIMMPLQKPWRVVAHLALGFTLLGTTPARAETLDSTTADTRTFLAFKVKEDAAAAWLPEGYAPGVVPKGPFQSANFMLMFIDRLIHLSPEGEPKAGGAYRMAAVVIPGRHIESGKPVQFIARIYGPHDGSGPYANSVKAAVRRELTRSGADISPLGGADAWEVDHDGGRLSVAFAFRAEVPRYVESESHPTSAADPSIRRIYRYRQLVDVVRSVPAEIDRLDNLRVEVSIPELVDAFDGSEQLIAVGVIPWYARETFLP